MKIDSPQIIGTEGAGLGIGITTPAADLHISGSTADAAILRIQGGSSEILFASGSGKVGIGTTTPSSILDASLSSGATSGFRFKGYSDASTGYLLSLGTQTYPDVFQVKSVNGLVTMGVVGAVGASPDLVLQTNSTERLRILSGGNVGIGTTSPARKLDVNGSGIVRGFLTLYGSGTNNALFLHNTAYEWGTYVDASNNFVIRDWNAAQVRLTIDTSGRVGIGTVPAATLHLVDTSGPTIRMQRGSNRFWVGAGYDDLSFVSGDSSTAVAVFDGFAGVGIGVTSSVDRLTVGPFSANNALTIGAGTTGYSSLYFGDGASGTDRYRGYIDYEHSSDSFIFGTAASFRMRIDSSGNVGIGATQPVNKLHLNGGKFILTSDEGSYGQLQVNAPSGGEATIVFGSTGSNQNAGGYTNAGVIGIGAYGYARDTLVLGTGYSTPTLFLKNGSVGIGTASPAKKLEIGSGDIRLGDGYTISWGNDDYRIFRNGTQLRLDSGGSPRLQIENDGRVGVNGSAGGDSQFQSYSNTSGRFAANFINDHTAGYGISVGSDSGILAYFYADSSRIGSPIGSISENGTNTSYNTSSDIRLKENITDADDAASIVDAINVVQYDWKSGPHQRYGLVAQDLNTVFPEAVTVGDDGDDVVEPWGVDYSKLVPMLVKEIQSLRARISTLENN